MRKLLFLCVCFIGLIPCFSCAQSGEDMLIYQIDGNRYFRKNFDANGKLKSYQTLDVGKLNVQPKKIEAKLTVNTFDEKGGLKGASQTIISCDPEAGEVMMGIFPFAGDGSNKSLKIISPSNKRLYPPRWRKEAVLEDFTYQLKIKGGAAGFFGTESQVSFSNRKVRQLEIDLFRISGKMTMTAYILGIKISTLDYNFFEEIKTGKGIVRQRFEEENGDFFTVEIQ